MTLFHCDDFGYEQNIDEKLLVLLDSYPQPINLSILTNLVCPTSLDKLRRLRHNHSQIQTGLHLNLTEGKSLSLKTPGTLVNKKGEFHPLAIFVLKLLLGRINPTEIRNELEKQLQFLTSKGIKVDSIDSHQHIHALSPIAEIVIEVAKKYKINYIRSYKNIKTITWIAKIIYFLLKTLACVSHFITFQKIGLPSSWKIDNTTPLILMSWENKSFDMTKMKGNYAYIIHLFLPFDRNKSYLPFFKTNR